MRNFYQPTEACLSNPTAYSTLVLLREIRFYLIAHNNDAAAIVQPFHAAACLNAGMAMAASRLAPSDEEWEQVVRIANLTTITVCDGCGGNFVRNGDHYCDRCNNACDDESQRYADSHEGSPDGGRNF